LPLFREGLRAVDYVEGKNIQLVVRSGDAIPERLAAQAVELAGLKVDILVAVTTPAVHAAKRAAGSIPIVMVAGDPVGTGLIAGLARPGGNITGISSTTAELGGKLLQLIRELAPRVRRIAVLANSADPFTKPFLGQLQSAGPATGMEIQTLMVRGADQYPTAFTEMGKSRVDAVIVQPSLPRAAAADMALKFRLPAFSPTSSFTGEGGLMSYAPDVGEIYRDLAVYVAKVLKGAKPADLPVQQPTKFELRVNLKVARALGVSVPPAILARADRVIE
jgi:putative ABC transport system substrate-binding protein